MLILPDFLLGSGVSTWENKTTYIVYGVFAKISILPKSILIKLDINYTDFEVTKVVL